ncbi:MAG: plasmid pRiA4b ORF-3 family protein [Chloroflexota bacterium]
MAKDNIYQIKVTLKNSKPPIWRRIRVRADTKLSQLHLILQAVMGWENYHLHQFVVGDIYFGEPRPDDYYELNDERKFTLSQITATEGFKFSYEYDFGDNWQHDLRVEKIMPPEPNVQYPHCITGKRACPPEDVGGVWGYADFLAAIKDPHHPEHQVMLDWVGGEFDPQAFDLDEVNQALRHL